MFKKSFQVSLTFSTMKKIDVICMGPLAEKILRMSQSNNRKLKLQKLFIDSGQCIYEPSLLSLGQSEILYQQDVKRSSRLKNEIKEIRPKQNILEMKNGEQFKYRQLIYSGDDTEWKKNDHIKGLKPALNTENSGVYADIPNSNLENLYGQLHGDIYFHIPKGSHFGYENIFALHLLESLKKLQAENPYSTTNPIKITILNEGEKFIPGNQEIDNAIKEELIQGGIQIVSGFEISKINYRAKNFISKDGKVYEYGSFYQYLPRKTPQLLQKAKIDPFDVNLQTLKNNQYPNISIVGNIMPTAYSYYTLNYMAHILSRNITNNLIKSQKQAIYRGDTVIPFWTGRDKLRYFAMNYNSTKHFNNLGAGRIMGRLLSWDKKLFGKREVKSYYNGGSYGLPFYISRPRIEEISRSSQDVPMFVKTE